MGKEKLIEKLIGDIIDINKFSGEHITVAELRTIEVCGLTKTLDLNTALISPSLVTKIKASHVNPYVEFTGVNYDKEFVYSPSFWLYLSKANGLKKAEPLVVSWESANNTMLIIDQGFVGTYKLTPRVSEDQIYWDDLSKPKYEVICNKLISHYDYPKHSTAHVQINKEYLGNYLELRKKVAVQVFTITGNIYIDADILQLLDEKDYYIEEYKQYEIRISKLGNKENIARFEVNGYKILENSQKSSNEAEMPVGHHWKGIQGLVTDWRARHEMSFEYVYVSDEVMSKYEDNNDYEIFPLFGSVKYKGQWAISHCERIEKNGIKIEVKKLYEGTPDEVINYWNKFSISLSDICEGENIVVKAERLMKSYFKLGRLLSEITNKICGFGLTPSDFISLDEKVIEYTGWSDFPDYKPITNHINLRSFSKEQFISRCKKLYVLIGENIKEKSLRRAVDWLGFPVNISTDFRSIKLLGVLLKYLHVSDESGLSLCENRDAVTERVLAIKDFDVISELLALNNIRQLDAHKNDKYSESKFRDALRTFGIEYNSLTNNYAKPCEQVYDGIHVALNRINALLLRIE